MNEIEKARFEYYVAATVFARSQSPELDRLMQAADILTTANAVDARNRVSPAALRSIYDQGGIRALLEAIGMKTEPIGEPKAAMAPNEAVK